MHQEYTVSTEVHAAQGGIRALVGGGGIHRLGLTPFCRERTQWAGGPLQVRKYVLPKNKIRGAYRRASQPPEL